MIVFTKKLNLNKKINLEPASACEEWITRNAKEKVILF